MYLSACGERSNYYRNTGRRPLPFYEIEGISRTYEDQATMLVSEKKDGRWIDDVRSPASLGVRGSHYMAEKNNK
jgi:hypothetical protein